MNKYPIFIGWDSREAIAYDVARNSILRRSDPKKVQIRPLELKNLPMLTRPIEQKDGKMWCPISQAPMATEFAISRFLTPILYPSGWSLFVDCDILCLADIAELFALADDKYAVMCVKHQIPDAPDSTKMDGQIQTSYSRKNWSSVVLYNGLHPGNQKLTLKEVNEWAGRDLHAFKWLEDSEIGELPPEWNYLVGVNPKIANPKIAHLTLGGPWLPTYPVADPYIDALWLEERALL